MMNAVEAMSEITEGSRELLIRTDTNESGGIVVAVRYSGPGLKPEDLHRLFYAVLHDQAAGDGNGIGNLPVDHRGARRPALSYGESR